MSLPESQPLPSLIALTPAGHLVMLRQNGPEPAAVAEDGSACFPETTEGFAASQAQGIIALASGRPDPTGPLPWTFWREFTARYLTALCQMPPSSRLIDPIDPPDEADLSRLSLGIPPMPGAEYCSAEVLRGVWSDLHAWCSERIGWHGGTSLNLTWRLVPRLDRCLPVYMIWSPRIFWPTTPRHHNTVNQKEKHHGVHGK